MKVFSAFCKKEWLEYIRKGRLTILVIIFLLFGVINPALAKLTPWIMKTKSDSLAEIGIIINEISVDALTSWNQFFNNISLVIIFFLIMISSSFTAEYQKKTLIPVITKGVPRCMIVLSKLLTMVILWTVLYWGSTGITYGYNAYFWDNSIAENLFTALFCYWLIGIIGISSVCFFSAVFDSNTNVLVGTAGIVVVSYLIGLISDFKKYVPTYLSGASTLITSDIGTDEFLKSIITGIIIAAAFSFMSIMFFNRKKI